MVMNAEGVFCLPGVDLTAADKEQGTVADLV
jgi:hypothetical protein